MREIIGVLGSFLLSFVVEQNSLLEHGTVFFRSTTLSKTVNPKKDNTLNRKRFLLLNQSNISFTSPK